MNPVTIDNKTQAIVYDADALPSATAKLFDPETWRRCGEAGFLGACAPEEYGGAGGDFLFDAIINEELALVRAHALMIGLHFAR